MKFDSIQAGETYYDVRSHKMGNTTMNTVGVWHIQVISTDTVNQTVTASWNGNPAKVYRIKDYSKWRKNKPLLVGDFTKRLANRAEIAAHKAAQQAKEAACQQSA